MIRSTTYLLTKQSLNKHSSGIRAFTDLVILSSCLFQELLIKEKRKVMVIQELPAPKLPAERHEIFWDSCSQLQDTQAHTIIMVIWKSKGTTAFFLQFL